MKIIKITFHIDILQCEIHVEEKFKDIKGVIRSRESKDKQHNGQKKNDKKAYNSRQNRKLD